MATSKSEVDWHLVGVEYRAGIKSVRQIASEHGVSHVAVGKRAAAEKWTRDLAAQIKAKADAKVTKAAVTTQVTTARAVTEQAVVEANAELQYRIRIEHRKDIGRTRNLFGALLGEVEGATEGRDGFDALVEGAKRLVAAGLKDADAADVAMTRNILGEVLESVRKLTSVGNRIDSAKKLTEMLEKLVRMEREAFGIRDDEQESSVDDLLKRVRSEMPSG